jgi:PEP-CTERM motif
MKRTSLYLVFAGLLSLAGPATARADLALTLTPFSGTNTDYTTAVSTETFLPYTDVNGRTVSGDATGDDVSRISPGSGIFQVEPSASFKLTFFDLAPGTTQAGFLNVNAGAPFVSAMVDNGDNYSTPISSPPGTITFFGFTDTTPFTSITLTFSGAESFNILDFVTATAATSAVPEPSSLTIVGGVVAASAAAASWRRRRARRGDRDR